MIVVSGNFFELMNNVLSIANDLKFELSGVGSPSVLVKSLMIGGEA
jgi:PmbA protein